VVLSGEMAAICHFEISDIQKLNAANRHHQTKFIQNQSNG